MPGPVAAPGRAIERAKDLPGALRRLMRYLRPHRNALIAVILTAALGTGLMLATPVLTGKPLTLSPKVNARACYFWSFSFLGPTS